MRTTTLAPGLLILLFAGLILSPGCGSNGGGGSSSAATVKNGSVSVLLTDGPAVELDHVFVEVTKVSLIPPGHRKSVVIFEGKERIDLLRFRDKDFLLAKQDVPVGKYEKIRLEIARVEVEPRTDCPEIKLPSGKIDLVPRGKFEVNEGESIQVRLDIDCGKSLSIHEAGNSGKCIFRPVVFVDVIVGAPPGCPPEIAGTIVKIEAEDEDEDHDGHHDDEDHDRDDDGKKDDHGKGKEKDPKHSSMSDSDELAELVVDLGSGRGKAHLEILAQTAIFGDDAQSAELAVLDVGDKLLARGVMESDGELEALWVIEGQPVDLHGTFETAITDGKFTFKTEASIEAHTTAGTVAFPECGETPVALSSILAGQNARLLGVQVQDGVGTFLRVAVIELGPRTVQGEITAIDRTTREIQLRLQDTTTATFTYDPATPISLIGDGALTAEDLRVGEAIIAQLEVGGGAIKIDVEPESLIGQVKDFDPALRTFNLVQESSDPNVVPAPVKVTVFSTATVILIEADQTSSQVDLSELKDGDQVNLFGLAPGEDAFDARTVLIRR